MDIRTSGHLGQISTRAKLGQMDIFGTNGHVVDWDKWRFGEMGTWGPI